MIKNIALATALAVSLAGCSGYNSWGPDKVGHITVGFLIGTVAEKLGIPEEEACGLVLFAGVAKELIDPVFTPMDVVATATYCMNLSDNK